MGRRTRHRFDDVAHFIFGSNQKEIAVLSKLITAVATLIGLPP